MEALLFRAGYGHSQPREGGAPGELSTCIAPAPVPPAPPRPKPAKIALRFAVVIPLVGGGCCSELPEEGTTAVGVGREALGKVAAGAAAPVSMESSWRWSSCPAAAGEAEAGVESPIEPIRAFN